MSRALFISLLVIAAGLNGRAQDKPSEPLRSRREFAKAINKVKEEMPLAQVLALLGRPDDIRTERDPGGISTIGTKEIWRYGTSGHLTPATLGEVYIDQKGLVQYVFGKGQPPAESFLEERELRRLLSALAEVPSYNAGWSYNPRKVIRAVNLLQPLGKEKALGLIDEFLRVTSNLDDGKEGVFLVLRALFEVPQKPGYLPPVGGGLPTPAQPKDLTLLPRFPIALEQDIPFLVVNGYLLSGAAQTPESDVEYFKKHGVIRTHPLLPVANPCEALETFAKSRRWLHSGKADDSEYYGRHLLCDQVLRLLDTVYRVEPAEYGSLLPWGDEAESQRQKIMAGAAKLAIRWDAKANCYTFPDGKVLSGIGKKHYRREIWKPELPGGDVQLIFERQSSKQVSVTLVENFGPGKARMESGLKVFEVGAKDKPIAEFSSGRDLAGLPAGLLPNASGAVGVSSCNKSIELREGDELQVELTINGKTKTSPKYKP